MRLAFFLFFLVLQGSLAEESKTAIDSAHDRVSSTILLISNRIDSFFGSQRGDDEANGSRLRVFYDHTFVQDKKWQRKTDIRFTLRLPQLENLFKLSFSRSGGNDTSKNNEVSQEQDKQNEATKRAKVLLIQSKNWHFNTNAGLRIDIPFNPFARARLRRTFTLFDVLEFNPTQEATWFLEEGFGLNFSHDIDYVISSTLLFRIVNSFFWRDETDNVTSSHGPVLFHQLTKRRALSYSLQAVGINKPTFHINNYIASINYRQLLHKDWLFLQVTPSLSFPETRQWKEEYALFVRLEAVFGSL